MENYGDTLGHWITALFESMALFKMRLIGVPALVRLLPVNVMEFVMETH